ncbi:hypothetical protein ACJJTC_015370 [Scirpophaga incertulas]
MKSVFPGKEPRSITDNNSVTIFFPDFPLSDDGPSTSCNGGEERVDGVHEVAVSFSEPTSTTEGKEVDDTVVEFSDCLEPSTPHHGYNLRPRNYLCVLPEIARISRKTRNFLACSSLLVRGEAQRIKNLSRMPQGGIHE